MNTNIFINYLSSAAELSEQFKNALNQQLKIEHYKPRQILFAGGQIENRLCFVQKGFARSYYYDQAGTEHTVRFWNQNDILLSYQGYWGQPSDCYTEIMEDTTLITLRYDDVRLLTLQFPESATLIKNILNQFHLEENTKQRLINLNAEQRFKELKKNNRLIFQKVPLKIIASYLNMSRETLSRIISRA